MNNHDSQQTTGLVFGILATVFSTLSYFVFGWLSFLGLAFGITATVLGAKYHSKGSGIAALVLGIVSIVASAVGVILFILALAALIRMGAR